MHSGPEKLAKCPRTAGAHSLSSTLPSLWWDAAPNTHSPSIRLLSLAILSIFFLPNFFPLHLFTSLHPIHHRTLTSICCPPSTSGLVIVFLSGLAGLYPQMVCCLLTNVSYCLASITAVAGWSQAERNEIPKATLSYFLIRLQQ